MIDRFIQANLITSRSVLGLPMPKFIPALNFGFSKTDRLNYLPICTEFLLFSDMSSKTDTKKGKQNKSQTGELYTLILKSGTKNREKDIKLEEVPKQLHQSPKNAMKWIFKIEVYIVYHWSLGPVATSKKIWMKRKSIRFPTFLFPKSVESLLGKFQSIEMCQNQIQPTNRKESDNQKESRI